jgi:hypothetical protein
VFPCTRADRCSGASQVPLERIKPRCPLRSIRLEPGVELHQRLRTEPVQPPLSIPPDLHQPGVAQHFEVTRHTWLMHPDLLDQLADRPLAAADGIKDPSSCRFGDHLENSDLYRHTMSIWLNIYMCNRMEPGSFFAAGKR